MHGRGGHTHIPSGYLKVADLRSGKDSGRDPTFLWTMNLPKEFSSLPHGPVLWAVFFDRAKRDLMSTSTTVVFSVVNM